MKILVCSDGSERARRALASAATIANATKAQTTIFGIVEAEADEPRSTGGVTRGMQESFMRRTFSCRS